MRTFPNIFLGRPSKVVFLRKFRKYTFFHRKRDLPKIFLRSFEIVAAGVFHRLLPLPLQLLLRYTVIIATCMLGGYFCATSVVQLVFRCWCFLSAG